MPPLAPRRRSLRVGDVWRIIPGTSARLLSKLLSSASFMGMRHIPGSFVAEFTMRRADFRNNRAPLGPHQVAALASHGDHLTNNLASLVKARDLLYMLTWRDIHVRYKQSIMG